MNIFPIDIAVQKARFGERVVLVDGCTGTVVDEHVVHLNVDGGVYRKVIWVDDSQQYLPSSPYIDPCSPNTATTRWYRVYEGLDECPVMVDNYEI